MSRPKYHQSEVQTFLKCGKQWEFRYLLGIKTPPKAALTVGSAVDAAVTRNLAQKVASGTDITEEEVTDVCACDFDARSKDTEWGEDDPGKQKDMALQLVKAHHKELAPSILPESVQEEFHIETDAGYDIGGTIDLTEKSGVIADTKTSKQKYAEDAVINGLQPAMYDFAYEALRGQKAKAFRFDVLIKPTKTIGPRTQQIEAPVPGESREHLFEAINNMHKAIQAGVTLPAPEGAWWCSKDWCGYWSMCKGKGRK